MAMTNDSFTKLCNEPESSNVWNSLRGFLVEGEVSKRKNEFRDSEVVLRWSGGTLSVWRQPFSSVGHEGLPISFPGLPLSSWPLVAAGVPLPLGESGSLPSLGVRPCPWCMWCTPLWSPLLQIAHRLFLQQHFLSSGFSLLSGP